MSIAAKVPSPRRMLDGVPPDTRVVIAGVTWEFYDRFSKAIRDGDNCRIAFDGKDIEMMTLGPLHERYKTRLDSFVAIVADQLTIDVNHKDRPPGTQASQAGGRTRLMLLFRSCEAACLCRGGGTGVEPGCKDYPNPDLAIEVDLSPSKIDRPGIYAALQIPELWRLREKAVSIEQLVPPGAYAAAERSRFLPVRSEDITRWVFAEYARDPITWKQRLRGVGSHRSRLTTAQARISRMTWPWTSVKRRSMPLWRKVSRVWSMPSRCSTVAWRS